MVDAGDLKSSGGVLRAGSSPALGTMALFTGCFSLEIT